MFFIEPTAEELTALFEEKLASGEVSTDDLRKPIEVDISFLDGFENMSLSDLIRDSFVATIEPAYLGAERIQVDKYSFQVSAVFQKDGYVFFSDGVGAVSLRRVFENLKKAAEQLL